jgi:osmotically-inducible protein OsmY
MSRQTAREVIAMDNEMTEWVAAELDFDSKVESEHIAISADCGVVTMYGTVTSLGHKHRAQAAVERVPGVRCIRNELQVRIPDSDGRPAADGDLRGAVLLALVLNRLVPGTIDAKVQDGLVTLVGTAVRQYQREEAELICAGVPGVIAVKNEILLAAAPGNVDF